MRKAMCVVKMAMCCIVLLIGSRASAAPITITETTDFSNTSPGGIIGTLDVGVNAISGQLDFLADDIADYFQLTLPAGMQITQWETFIYGYDDDFIFQCSSPPCGALPSTSDSGSYTTTGPGFPLNYDSPWGGSTSGLTFTGPTTFIDGFLLEALIDGPLNGWQLVSGPSYEYIVNYTVESNGPPNPVPEPTSMVLLASGLAGMGVRRWRQRRTM